MNKFISENVLENNCFIGDINIVTSTKNEITVSLAKKDAVLLQISEELFVDLDYIKSKEDINKINELLNSNSINNNIILSNNINNPYVGKLYISNLRNKKEKNIKKLIK